MIKTALSYIAGALNDYLGAPPDVAMLGNIAFATDTTNDAAPLKNRVVLSLVGVEEDKISKDPLPYTQQGNDTYVQEPAVNLCLFLLFSANFDSYDDTLAALGKVVGFFQQKSHYTPENTSDLPPGIDKLLFDLYTVSLGDLHHIWTMLGGKYIPSVLYRLRLLTIQQAEQTGAGVIRRIRIKENMLQ